VTATTDLPPWQVFCGDGASGLFNYGEVDCVWADVPFAKDVDDRNDAETLRDNEFDFEPMTPELMESLAQAIGARCRRWAIIKTSDFEVNEWRAALTRAGMDVLRIGHWVRLGTKPQMTGDRPAQGVEPLVIAHSRIGERKWNGGGKPATYHAPVVRGEAKLHPTHTPPQLIKQIYEDFSDPGELWCDNTFGCCESGVVAVSTGRRFVGWELEEYYVNLACERMPLPLLDNRPMQGKLFAPSASSRAANARAELDRDLMRLVNATDPAIGIGKIELQQLLEATPAELSRALGRLRKKQLVRREGKTNDSRYFRAITTIHDVHVSTGDSQP